MLYDTIYACQDKKDDVKMGVRSTALLFGSWIRPLLIACAIGFVAMLAFAGAFNGQSLPYFIISVGGTALHLVWQFATVDLEEPESCWSEFNSLCRLNQTLTSIAVNFQRNGHLGWTVWGGLMLDYLLRVGAFNGVLTVSL